MQMAEFDYDLPPELIAQRPAARREQARLLVLDRATGAIAHRHSVADLLSYLVPGDLLVLNDSRVIPARLRGRKIEGGGQLELLLVERVTRNRWWSMVRPGKRVRAGTRLLVARPGVDSPAVEASVLSKNDTGQYQIEFEIDRDILELLPQLGEVPLPPYITRLADAEDLERYQTVFARDPGSVAAPTAGLHFTPELLDQFQAAGIQLAYVTLHVGLGTFAPVKAETVEGHVMHEEQFSVPPATSAAIAAAREAGRRVVAVGTTTVRVLESVAGAHAGRIIAGSGCTAIYIYPPYRFQVVDALLTNFHLPRSTLLMLVSAFAAPGQRHGRELILRAYAEAVAQRYRFFSYGDAMFIV